MMLTVARYALYVTATATVAQLTDCFIVRALFEITRMAGTAVRLISWVRPIH